MHEKNEIVPYQTLRTDLNKFSVYFSLLSEEAFLEINRQREFSLISKMIDYVKFNHKMSEKQNFLNELTVKINPIWNRKLKKIHEKMREMRFL